MTIGFLKNTSLANAYNNWNGLKLHTTNPIKRDYNINYLDLVYPCFHSHREIEAENSTYQHGTHVGKEMLFRGVVLCLAQKLKHGKEYYVLGGSFKFQIPLLKHNIQLNCLDI